MNALFDNLSARLQEVFKRLRGKGKLSEKDVDEALREVRLALLEADVNFKVVKDFAGKVRERAVGREVMESLTPAQQVIKIVRDELTFLMGGTQAKIDFSPKPSTVVVLAGLQGSGKTTVAAKLANLLKRQGKRPLMVACDIYRPAAIRQLEILGQQIDIPVFTGAKGQDPAKIAKAGIEFAYNQGRDVALIDTAGRLHIDEEMMEELERIKEATGPTEILLVVDAMTGQDAVNVAQVFNQRLNLDGVILTKLDGDARGGAALSVRAVTGKPIKFVGTGEKLDALEPFYPDRMASRILGMGDVLSLVERAEATIDAEQARKLEEKIRKAEFTLEDFLDQLRQMRKMGPIEQILGMIPGFKAAKLPKGFQVDEKQLSRIEAIINSMTPKERLNPTIIDGSRRKRVALGSGTKIQDVNALLKQFEQTRRMLKQLGDMEKSMKRGGRLRMPFT